MIIGIPKEVKTDEFRVGATPSNIALLVKDGHELFV
jgi:alanine dehydrogenase